MNFAYFWNQQRTNNGKYNKNYFDAGVKRLEQHKQELKLF